MSDQPKSQIPDFVLTDLVALCEQAPDGAIVELGVYKGGSAAQLARVARGRALHLFDTFEGIPFRGELDLFNEGAFRDVDEAAIRQALPEAHFHKGVFPATLPDELTGIAFVHLDADQYQSTYDGIRTLWPRMLKGAILAFDDSGFASVKKAIADNQDLLPAEGRRTKENILYYVKESL
jgi:O-methyltransferase